MPRLVLDFQEMIARLQQFWLQQGCLLLQAYDCPMGAGTFHPATALRAIGPEPWRSAYVQACRRPADGRYAANPHRSQHYYQLQVVLKPSPHDMQALYLKSLSMLGIEGVQNDIRFIPDNWESPTLGAWGPGWEVWLNGMEISQLTYFQRIGGLNCQPVTGEITYGLERIALFLQQVAHISDIVWAQGVTYGHLFRQQEQEFSRYHFDHADINILTQQFEHDEQAVAPLIAEQLVSVAYEMVIRASHIFNSLDARRALSTTERQHYVLRVRQLAGRVAQAFYEQRRQLGFPLLRHSSADCTRDSEEYKCE